MNTITTITSKCALAAGLVACLMSGAANGAERKFRVHLLQFTSEGYEPYKNSVSSLDVGILERKTDAGAVECELLAPKSPKASAQPWAPVDLYSNLTDAQTQAARVGEKDLFFEGDDNNRNAKGESFDKTVIPDKLLTNSLDFDDKKIEKSSASFFFRFTRKGILLERRMNVKVRPVNGACLAVAHLCTTSDKACSANTWRKLNQVVVYVDVKGGLKDKFKPPASDRDRNDIAKIQLKLANLDKDENPSGEVEEVIEKK